jgi:hypothetical protein
VATGAFAAAPDAIDPPKPESPGFSLTAPVVDYALDTELVVNNWVVCVSQAFAEQLVRAREESIDKALSAYADLKQARTCGQFAELRVILQERLYSSDGQSGHDARVFGALVNLSGKWASAYLVFGGLPDE